MCEKGTFMWAVAQMKEGKKATREEWSAYVYYFLKDTIKQRCINGTEICATITELDIEATDWEVVEDKQTLASKNLCGKTVQIYLEGTVIFYLKDIKAAIKEFIDVTNLKIIGDRSQYHSLLEEANEIFGKELIE